MARIAGIDLPKDKRVEIGLTYIYGIGRTSAQKILAQTGTDPDTRVRDLTEAQEAALQLLSEDPDLTSCPATAERVEDLFTQQADALN